MSEEMESFPAGLIRLVKNNANKDMIIYDAGCGITRYSYERVYELCNRFRSLYRLRGIKRGDSIVTILPNSPEAIICFFAALLEGINYAPLSCSITNRELGNWVSIVKPKMIIKKTELADYTTDIETIDCECDGDFSWLNYASVDETIEDIDAHIYLMTSGTTGDPKAMSIDSRRLWNSAKAFSDYYGLSGSGVRFWNYLPMSYLGGLFNLAFIPIYCSGSFVISEPFSGRTVLNYWNFVKKHDINALWFVPSIIQGLLKLSGLIGKNVYDDTCKRIKIAFLGTAPVSLSQKEEFENKFGIRLYENFALSETTFITAENEDSIRFREQSSVGRVLPYVDIKIQKTIEVGNVGIIWVKTPYLFRGYLSNDGTTLLETDDEGYFNTKDVGYLNDDGVLVISGRERDIIKKGGFFVSLVEIETVMSEVDGIDEAVAIPIKNEFYGETYWLCIKLSENKNVEKQLKNINMWMIDNFVSYKLPERIVPIDNIPRTPSGKIQKNKIVESLN